MAVVRDKEAENVEEVRKRAKGHWGALTVPPDEQEIRQALRLLSEVKAVLERAIRRTPKRGIAVFVATLCFLGSPAVAGGDVNALFGPKFLSQDVQDYGYNSAFFDLGIMSSFWGKRWPIAVAADLTTSTVSKSGDARWQGYSASELHLGARKLWMTGRERKVRPYVGGGVALVRATVTEGVYPSPKGETRADAGIGVWLGGGVSWRLRTHLNLGVDARFSQATVNLPLGSLDAAIDVKAGGFQLCAIVGYGW